MRANYQDIGLYSGIILYLILQFVGSPQGLPTEAWQVACLLVLMGIWWSTEAIPVPATSLLPIVILPLTGAQSLSAATAPYAHPVIFLLLGGFIVAMGMQQSGLHRRIALNIVARAGDRPSALIGGFMVSSAILSMWISNTATTLMMIPIALSVAETVLKGEAKGHRFTIALFIGIAWSASIGGLGTIIGTPPNAFVVSFIADETGKTISFLEWMMLGVPVVAVMVPLAWLVLTRIAFPFKDGGLEGGGDVVQAQLKALGNWSPAEKRIAYVFALMTFCWMTLPLLKTLPGLAHLSNTIIAVAGAIAMFLIPSGPKKGGALLTWEQAVKLPWGVLLLFGGGLALAKAMSDTGLAAALGNTFAGLSAAPLIVLVFAIVTSVIFLTELTSNTATTAALVPVLAGVAAISGLEPVMLAAPVAMAASCAFMLPVATAPNAVIYASGQVTIPNMARAGLWLNCLGAFALTGLCSFIIPLVFL